MRKTSNSYSDQHYINLEEGFAFDGVDDYIVIPRKRLSRLIDTPEAPHSISFFVSPVEISEVVPSYLTDGGSDPTNNQGLVIAFTATLLGVTFEFRTGNFSTLRVRAPITGNKLWQHIVITKEQGLTASNVKIYVNAVEQELTVLDDNASIGTYVPNNNNFTLAGHGTESNLEGRTANLQVFNNVLNQSEIEYINRYVGVVPDTAKESCIFNLPLQTEDFNQDSTFNSYSSATAMLVTQTSHPFNAGDFIYDNVGTWELADSTSSSTYSNPPTIVVENVDANNFRYAQAGLVLLPNHGVGAEGDYVYVNNNGTGSGSEVQIGNIVARVLSKDVLLIAGEQDLYCKTKTAQFNTEKQGFNYFTNSLEPWTDLSVSPSTVTSSGVEYIVFDRVSSNVTKIEYSGPNLFTPTVGKTYKVKLALMKTAGDATTNFRVELGGQVQDINLPNTRPTMVEAELGASTTGTLKFSLETATDATVNLYWFHIYEEALSPTETYCSVEGKLATDLRHVVLNSSRDDSNSDFYSTGPFTGNAKAYNGSSMYDTISNYSNKDDLFAIYMEFDLVSYPGTGNLYGLLETSDVDGDDGYAIYFQNQEIVFNYSPGVDFYEFITPINLGKNKILFYISLATSDVRIYINGSLRTLTSESYTIDRITSTSRTIGIGKLINLVNLTYFDGTISKLEVIDSLPTENEIEKAFRLNGFLSSGRITSDFRLAIDFDKTDYNRSSLTTFKGTPSHTIISFGGRQYMEDKSNFPPIRECFRLLNNEGGNPDGTNHHIALDKSSLPSATDDFTFHWSGYLPSLALRSTNPIVADSNILNDLFILTNQYAVATGRKGIRLEYSYEDKVGGTLQAGQGNLRCVYIGNSNGTANVIDYAINGKADLVAISCDIVVKGTELSFHVNGKLIGTDTIARVDLSTGVEFSLGVHDTVYSSQTSTNTIFTNSTFSTFGYWKRALNSEEILHLHGNGNFNNPWDYMPLNSNTRFKDNLVQWIQGQANNLYAGASEPMIKNLADTTGTTDGTCVNFTGATVTDKLLRAIDFIYKI